MFLTVWNEKKNALGQFKSSFKIILFKDFIGHQAFLLCNLQFFFFLFPFSDTYSLDFDKFSRVFQENEIPPPHMWKWNDKLTHWSLDTRRTICTVYTRCSWCSFLSLWSFRSIIAAVSPINEKQCFRNSTYPCSIKGQCYHFIDTTHSIWTVHSDMLFLLFVKLSRNFFTSCSLGGKCLNAEFFWSVIDAHKNWKVLLIKEALKMKELKPILNNGLKASKELEFFWHHPVYNFIAFNYFLTTVSTLFKKLLLL